LSGAAQVRNFLGSSPVFEPEYLTAEPQFMLPTYTAELACCKRAALQAPEKRDNRKKLGTVVSLLGHLGHSFDPEALGAITTAYDAVLMELDLSDREGAGALMVARRVIEVAARGERDPQMLAAAALEILSR
jgi:hypothetical protein